ncbi:MAG TPA: acetate kinase [Ignavibacteriales bacterium]|nr:acetate kinase [Ignavibacteriales bacterium]HOL81499.1 acetate kinase [Ignavibacteriales bacterium]HOM65397.1 acetate kinase [Ignavibacteriales bacterium]HPD67026.1 acetate kinase [Ignavibacteriales bacterium]HPP33574.1 acetate kinase [Ignavibacteriales bacterium]
MKVLVLNCGSSSIKYQFIDTNNPEPLAKGLVERIGMSTAVLTHQKLGDEKIRIVGEILDHKIGIEYVLAVLLSPTHGVIKDRNEIDAIGHRVVHGGESFSESVLITPNVIQAIKDNIELAPLHNPANIKGIEACKTLLPNKPQVAVFDTAFHSTIPQCHYTYGLPMELYKKYKIRKYGFHGTSHKYVASRAAAMLGRPLEELKIITAHLGNGASITAVKNGKSYDTSLGFTTLDGLLMGTRCGELDPGVLPYIMGKEELTVSEAITLITKHSGVVGVSGVGSDMREVEEAALNGNERAQLALNIYAYRIKKFIGAYIAIMNGCDAIVFTGGVGENSDIIRDMVCKDMDWLGIKLDAEKNKTRGFEIDMSAPDYKIRVLRIPTNEELVIALDTAEIVEKEMKERSE